MKDANKEGPTVGEKTKTPRTDAKVLELESEEDCYYTEMIGHAYELETDLQHLARVAGEALDGMIKVARADDWHEASTGRQILLRDAEAALSEINRIKQP